MLKSFDLREGGGRRAEEIRNEVHEICLLLRLNK
jgi:hypothetical protein